MKPPPARRCELLALDAHPDEAHLDACSRRLFTDWKVGPTGRRYDWTLVLSSDLLPGLRIYKATDRYPDAAFVDLVEGVRVREIDVPLVNYRLQQRSVTDFSRDEAKELAEFVVRAENEPFSADGLETKVRAEGDHFVATVRFEATTVWSPPWNPMIAGSKRSEFLTTVVLADGCIRSESTEEVRVIRTSPQPSTPPPDSPG